MMQRLSIPESLGLAASALRPAVMLPAHPDPLRLQLAPMGSLPGGLYPDAQTVRVFGALYLYAEAEQAGIVSVAEAMAQNRDAMPIHDDRGAGKLDAFAFTIRDWFDRDHRNALFARLFGSGAGCGFRAM